MPKNKCHRGAVTEWTCGSGATISFHFSRTLASLLLLLLAFVHSSYSSSLSPTFCSSGSLTNMVWFHLHHCTEKAGSITFPAARCGVPALRPIFGIIGRSGVMSISESLDKLGPFCRSATDCVIILDIVREKDLDDPSSKHSSLDDPFLIDITKLTVGYLDDAEMEVISHSSNFTKQKLLVDTNNLFDNWQLVRDIKKQVLFLFLNHKMVPYKLNYTVDSVQGILNFTMDVDMLANFEEWQRSGEDNVYETQDQWPTELRQP